MFRFIEKIYYTVPKIKIMLCFLWKILISLILMYPILTYIIHELDNTLRIWVLRPCHLMSHLNQLSQKTLRSPHGYHILLFIGRLCELWGLTAALQAHRNLFDWLIYLIFNVALMPSRAYKLSALAFHSFLVSCN